jgi:hypothetical protein
MKGGMTALRCLVLLAGVAGFVFGEPEFGVAQNRGPYTFDLRTAYPLAYKHWHELIPDQLITTKWLSDFNGTATPLQSVVISGEPMLFGTVCEPHDCGANRLDVLISADQSRLVGIATLSTEPRKTATGRFERSASYLIVGEPSGKELTCLRVLEGDVKREVRSCPR